MRALLGKTWFVYLLLSVAIAIAYFPGLRGPMVFDDTYWHGHMQIMPQTNGYWHQLFKDPVRPDTVPYGRPLLKAIFVTECYLFNHNRSIPREPNDTIEQPIVWPFHLVSLLLHLINVWLVFRLLCQLMGQDNKTVVWLIAAIWALHPIQTDAVLYISQQSELLVSCFILGTLNCALAGQKKSAILLCAAGMFAKELMIVTPLLVWLASSIGRKEHPWKTLKNNRWFYAILLLTCGIVVALMISYPRSHSTGNIHRWNNWTYLLTQSHVLCYYLLQCVWPMRLAIDPYFPKADTIASIWPFGCIILGLLIFTGWMLCKRHRLAFWLAWFFIILAPTSSVIPITTEIAALRRMYLPLLGVLVLLTCAMGMILHKFKLQHMLKPVMIAGCFALSVGTWNHSHAYQSQVRLYEDNIAKFPNHRRSMRNLAAWYFQAHDYENALRIYDMLVAQWPDSPRAQFDRATTMLKLNRTQQTIDDLNKLTRQFPNDPGYHCKLGMAYLQNKQPQKALACFRKSIELAPRYSQPKMLIAYYYQQQNNLTKAIYWMQQAVYFIMAPNGMIRTSGDKSWNDLGLMYVQQKQYEKARDAFVCAYLSIGGDVILVDDIRHNLMKVRDILGIDKHTRPTPKQFPVQSTKIEPLTDNINEQSQ